MKYDVNEVLPPRYVAYLAPRAFKGKRLVGLYVVTRANSKKEAKQNIREYLSADSWLFKSLDRGNAKFEVPMNPNC